MPDRRQAAAAMRRVQRRKSQLKREMELFYVFVLGVFFGVLSALLASFLDASVRGIHDYPGWYVITISAAYIVTLCMLGLVFVRLRRQRKDLQIMEENFEEMMR